MIEPSKRLLCSTGTMVSRFTNYDYRSALRIIRELVDEGRIYGAELMMLKRYYEDRRNVLDAIARADIPVPVIHCEKDVGGDLSRAAALDADGKRDEALRLCESLTEDFCLNCRFGKAVGAGLMVLHLWSGLESDSHIEFNLSFAPRLYELAAEHSIKLLFETIPCTVNDPAANLTALSRQLDSAEFTYDTRLTAIHGQEIAFLRDPMLAQRIRHVHISDFIGKLRDFSALRPIYHPREGQIDFEAVARALSPLDYLGYFTLEAPIDVLNAEGKARLASSFEYLSHLF